MYILKPYLPELVVGLLLLVIIQFGLMMALSARISHSRRILRGLLTGPTGEDLETMLRRCLEESQRALQRGDALEASLTSLVSDLRACVQHVGLVRYDAYGDVSGKQSFSLAILNGYQNGAIITGLFGRQDGRCYGKSVHSGRTEQALTEEETSALEMALQGGDLPAPSLNGRRRVAR